MKLIIEIDNDTYLQSYLSILSIGLLECLERKVITCEDAMDILYFPGMIDRFEELFPNLGNAIHLGTELEDVESLIPDRLEESIAEIKELNMKSIGFDDTREQHVFYKII